VCFVYGAELAEGGGAASFIMQRCCVFFISPSSCGGCFVSVCGINYEIMLLPAIIAFLDGRGKKRGRNNGRLINHSARELGRFLIFHLFYHYYSQRRMKKNIRVFLPYLGCLS
jgi:hypothetical protein